MTTETATRKFRCPSCGHKHAADLSPMEGHPEIHGKVPCAECHTLMWISLGEDGTATAELYEAHLHEVYEKKAEEAVKAATEQAALAAAATPAPAPAPASATTSGPGWIGPILAAAVVAAIVSFALGAGRGGEEADAGASAPDPALQRDVQTLSDALAASNAARAEMADSIAALEDAVAQHAAALAAAAEEEAPADEPDAELAELKQKLEDALARYDELNGRIEGNYTNLRQALKRLQALEGK